MRKAKFILSLLTFVILLTLGVLVPLSIVIYFFKSYKLIKLQIEQLENQRHVDERRIY